MRSAPASATNRFPLARPIKTRQNAGERAGEIGHAIGDHRQVVTREPGWIAVGIEDDFPAGRAQEPQYPVENRDAADRDQRLVAASHAARKTARKDEAER